MCQRLLETPGLDADDARVPALITHLPRSPSKNKEGVNKKLAIFHKRWTCQQVVWEPAGTNGGDSVSKRSPLNSAEQPIKGLLNYSNGTGQALKLWPGLGWELRSLAGICKQTIVWETRVGTERFFFSLFLLLARFVLSAHSAPHWIRRIPTLGSYFPPGLLLCK